MKVRISFLVASIAIGFLSTATAQVNEKFGDLNDEIEMLRTVSRAERQSLITAGMQLSPDESQRFWPLYRQYRDDLTKINDRAVRLITDYAASYDSLSDSQARRLLEDFLAVQAQTVALRRKYVPRFAKVLPAIKVARFYQLENKLDAVQNLTFVRDVPLAR